MNSIQNQDEISIYLMDKICEELPNKHGIDITPNNITSMLKLLEVYKATSNKKLKFLIDQLFNHTGGSWAKLLKNDSTQNLENHRGKVYRGNPITWSQASDSDFIEDTEPNETKPPVRMYRGAPVIEKERISSSDKSITNEDSHQFKKQRIYRGNVVDN